MGDESNYYHKIIIIHISKLTNLPIRSIPNYIFAVLLLKSTQKAQVKLYFSWVPYLLWESISPRFTMTFLPSRDFSVTFY